MIVVRLGIEIRNPMVENRIETIMSMGVIVSLIMSVMIMVVMMMMIRSMPDASGTSKLTQIAVHGHLTPTGLPFPFLHQFK